MNLQNFNLAEWFLGNIAWWVLSVIAAGIFIKFIPSVIKAVSISKKILKGNRDTRGNGWGKYSADRFLDVWFSSKKQPPAFIRGRFYYKTFNNPNSRHWMDVIDNELVNLGLISIVHAPRGYEAVFPVKNFRNKLVAKFTKWYLIKFIGDNPQYYKNMEDEAKKLDAM